LAYIVFINKDITDFGSSIPSYRFEIETCSADAVQSQSSEGWTITQRDAWGSDPNFEHPFRGEIWEDITIAAVFRAREMRHNQNDQPAILNPMPPNGHTMGIGYRHPNQHYIECRFVTYEGVAPGGGAITIAQAAVEIENDNWMREFDWHWDHWYGVYACYSYSLNRIVMHVANMSVQELDGIGFDNPNPARRTQWPGPPDHDEGTNTQFWWGCGNVTSTPEDPLAPYDDQHKGPISNVFIHNRYYGAYPWNASPMFTKYGVVDVGVNGEKPFGEVPKVYLPRGRPVENKGTVFVGNDEDFYIDVVHNYDLDLPPIDDGTN